MFLVSLFKFKLFQSTGNSNGVLQSIFSKRVHRKPFKIKNEFAYKKDFKKILENTKHNRINKIVSSDVITEGNLSKKRKSSGGDYEHSRNSFHRMRKNISLEYKGDIIFGIHPVYLALMNNKRKFYQLYTTSATTQVEETSNESVLRRKEIMNLAKSLNIEVKNVSPKDLKCLVPDVVHQGVCLDASHMQLLEWKENECVLAPDEFPLWLVLEEILDPMNVGAIIRSAYYFGVKKIFTVRGNSCKMSPTVSKASSGAMEIMDIYQIENLEYFVKVMKAQSWNIVSTRACNITNTTECRKLVNVSDFRLRTPTILVLGNEGRGVSSVVQTLCNSFISIYPSYTLQKGIDSLNVSVATGVILHCLFNSWKDNLK